MSLKKIINPANQEVIAQPLDELAATAPDYEAVLFKLPIDAPDEG